MARLKSPTTIGGAPIKPEGATTGQGLVWNGTEYAPGTVGGGGGDPGTLAHVHVQGAPASVWTINHPLSFRPGVTVVDSSGEQVEGEVDYVDADTVTVTFSAAFSGTAYLS